MKKIIFAIIIIFAIFYVNSPEPKTRYFGELLSPDILTGNDEVKILFVGDMMFDRYIRQVVSNKGEDYIFSCIGDFLKDSDLVVGNLEGPITDNPSISLGTEIGSPDNYVFTFPPGTAKLLARNNIKIVNLGNNHTNNFGVAGIDSTKKYLGEAGVNYIDKNLIYRTKISGQKISFISYNEFGGDSSNKIAEKIKEEKQKNRIVFVYAHWGEEYSEVPTRVKDTANLFAKAGADFAVGSHPHIILPSQEIGGTVVYYSLGNFIFDQYWDESVSTGLILEMNIKKGTFNKSQIAITEHKVFMQKDGRTCLIN